MDTAERSGARLPGSNYLLTEETARPHFSHTSNAARIGPTILIVGAGFTGISAALHLAKLRRISGLPARILLLEAGRVACGPSGRSAGHICGLQALDPEVRRSCGSELSNRLIAAAREASYLVRALVAQHKINCDLRDGYVTIGADGAQKLVEDGTALGIESYAFALGMAQVAVDLGVEIREGVCVTALQRRLKGWLASTTEGDVQASWVLACGGHRIAEEIALLAPLRCRTTELRVSTIVTDPLPNAVLCRAMPAAAGRRFPFANDSANAAYGSIDRYNRLIFGACATAWGKPSPGQILRALRRLLPTLLPDYHETTGRELGWQPLGIADRLNFTRNCLPDVGSLPDRQGMLYVQGLGGHGIALGTLLGKAAADKLWAWRVGRQAADTLFDTFASIPHGWLPSAQPWRSMAACVGLWLR
jgi:glycine/D-amino acid oxidase-like deaminating enzyme